VVDDALRAFAGYHTQEVLAPRGGELVLRDTRLLFYYQNRLAAHGLAYDAIAPKGVAPARPPKIADKSDGDASRRTSSATA
jgi:glycerol-3-phosphate O-acyltransferase